MHLSRLKHTILSGFCAAFILSPLPVFAAEQGLQVLTVSRLGDVELDCNSLSQEAALMRDIVATTQELKDDAEVNGHGIGVAGAIGGLVVGTATGGLGLAAAGLIAGHLNSEKGDEADTVQDIAAQRRILMMGIYNAKRCIGPIEHAMYIPEMEEEKTAIDKVSDRLASVAPAGGNNDKAAERKPRYNE